MTHAERQLEEAKAVRRSTRATLNARLSLVKGDLDEKSVGARIADRVGEDAKLVLEEAQIVARTHRRLLAGTIAALTLWIFRNPLRSLFDRMTGREPTDRDKE